mgnify:FL=1
MKKSMLFSVALAGLMLGSCSSSDDLNGSGTSENKNGNGYVAFTINLPSQPSSRASSSFNDDYKDGMASEYAVKDATLLLFSGTDEASANFVAAYKLSTSPWTAHAGDGNNITTTSKKVVQKVTQSSANLKALVILNNNNVFTVDEATNELKFNGTDFKGTYGDFLKKADATQGKNLTANGFYMANAPLCSEVGGTSAPSTSAKITTLADLEGKIYNTESEAQAGDAAQIYVERAVAKVTMANPSSVNKADNGTTGKVEFKVTGWAIDNFNKTSYLVRNTEGLSTWLGYASKGVTTNGYRFVGSSPVATGLYRTYFAKDMNFDSDATDFDRATSYQATFGDEAPQYCFENTFDVLHQIEDQTTLVTIKAQLNNGDDFYIVGGDQTKLYTKTELEKLVKDKFISVEESWIKTNQKAGSTVGEGDLKVVFDKADAGEVAITSITVDKSKLNDGATLPPSYKQDVSDAVGSLVHYKNGESYYTVRVKHFGDDLTPWKSGELGVKVGDVYPTTNQAENWLGRYSVLRNNWYELSVTDVRGLGSATVPKLTKTTDDELDSYIAVQINVLSWAKRTQSTVLH